MADGTITGADLAPYARFVRQVKSTDGLRAIGIDDDDMQAEAQTAVWRAVGAYRERHKLDDARQSYRRGAGKNATLDELRFVRRAIKNAVLTKLRLARTQGRGFGLSLDHSGFRQAIQSELYGTHLSGAFGHAPEVTETPDEANARTEHEQAIQRAAARVREAIGAARYAKLIEGADRLKPNDPKLQSLRGLFDEAALGGMEVAMTTATAKAPTEVKIEDLSDDELARVAIVQEQPIVSFTRSMLVKIVRKVNKNPEAPGGVDSFPECFRNPEVYDPNHAACGGDCDYRRECRANIAKYADPAIEEKLAASKTPPAEARPIPPAKSEKPPLVLAPPTTPEAAAEIQKSTTAAGHAEYKPNRPRVVKKGAKSVVSPDPKPADAAAPKQEDAVKAPTKPAPDFTPPAEVGPMPDPAEGQVWKSLEVGTLRVIDQVGRDAVVAVDVDNGRVAKIQKKRLDVISPHKGYALVGENEHDWRPAEEPAANPAEAAAPKTAKAAKGNGATKPAKAPKKAKDGKPAPTKLVEGIFFSARRGVIPAGQKGYSKRGNGERFFRLPQGSAGYMRACAVGTTAERVWAGHTFKVKKISNDGAQPKWRLVSKDGHEYEKPMEDTLGKITFHLTKNTAWSAAKFWALLPPELDSSSPAFNPKAFDAGKYQVYGKGD